MDPETFYKINIGAKEGGKHDFVFLFAVKIMSLFFNFIVLVDN
jgi:hypothetical protein